MSAPISPPLWVVVVGLVVAAAGTLMLAVYTATSIDGDRTRRAFAILLASVFVWTGGYGGRLLTPNIGGKLIWHGVLYIGVVTAPVAWFVFALHYAGRGRYLNRRALVALLLVPGASLSLMYTNTFHHLFYETIDLASVGQTPVIATTAGPYWWVHFGYSYLLIGAGIVLLGHFALTTDSLYRVQTVTLLLAGLFPVGANAMTIFGMRADAVVDLTPLAFALSCLLLFASIFYGRFLDLVPVAHEAVIRTLEDGILVVDEDDRIVSANPAATAILADENEHDALVGTDLGAVEPTLAVAAEETENVTKSGVARGFEATKGTGQRPDWFWVRKVDLEASTDRAGSILTLTEITEKKRFERQLRNLHRTNQQLMVAKDEQRIVEIAIESAADVLDLPITGIWRHDETDSILEPVGMTDKAKDVLGRQPVLEPGESLAWEAFTDDELKTYSDVSTESTAHNPDTPIASEVLVPLGDWGVMSSGSTTQTEFRDVDFDLLRLLAGAVERALARNERERRIQHLQRRTSALMRAEEKDEIAREAVETADEVLGLPLSGIHLQADNEYALEATAVTRTVRERFDELPTYQRDTGDEVDELIWDVFESGESLVVSDVTELEANLADRPIQSVIVHALGEHGVFITSSPDPDAFDRKDRALADLFVTTVTAALDRVQREQEIRERERELRRQNERLEEFTSVVSHDLRSPLNEVDVYLDIAASEYDDDRLDSAISANSRAKAMIDDLLRLARQGKTVEDPEAADLAETVRGAWQAVPNDAATLTVNGSLGTVAADQSRLRQVFENLFRNAVEHGSTSPPSETQGDALEHGSTNAVDDTTRDNHELQIRVGRLAEGRGVYVADDGPGIPAEEREEVFSHGYTTIDSGTGFGLAIVKRIVEAHGWDIRACESADGGARFEIDGIEDTPSSAAQSGAED